MFNFVVVNEVLKMFLWRKLKKKKSLKDYIFEKYLFMLVIKVQTIFTKHLQYTNVVVTNKMKTMMIAKISNLLFIVYLLV